ncbi:hypothetical protein [Streptacidiphilus sp. EB103A]|uniref:hypothetical protein n=1 Tax=Streptacidiphilus sp. EB103A TaxID=3156275 RepID=UPI003510F923
MERMTEQAIIDRRVLAQRDADGWLFLVEAAQTGLASLRTAWQSLVRRPGWQRPARLPSVRGGAPR